MTPDDFKALGFATTELMEFFRNGRTLGMALGVTRRSQEQLYQLAHRLYGQAKYGEAGHIFSLLTTANHLDRRFSLGCAACAHMQRRHQDALGYYGVAFLLDLTDPEPPLYMAESLLAMGERAKARQMLDYGLRQAQHQPRHQAQVPRFKALLALMEAPPDAVAEATPSTPSAVSPVSAVSSKEQA